jgi:hypothetical protein
MSNAMIAGLLMAATLTSNALKFASRGREAGARHFRPASRTLPKPLWGSDLIVFGKQIRKLVKWQRGSHAKRGTE